MCGNGCDIASASKQTLASAMTQVARRVHDKLYFGIDVDEADDIGQRATRWLGKPPTSKARGSNGGIRYATATSNELFDPRLREGYVPIGSSGFSEPPCYL